MRIVIDMQGAQTNGSRNRGIGRYTLALTKEMVRLRDRHEVILALNGLFPETVESLRTEFSGYLPQEDIYVWDSVGPVNSLQPANEARRHVAELSREAFLASLKPDIILSTSLFEGLVDDAITSIGSFLSQPPTAVILYDLIPLIHRAIYLENPEVERWYLNKIDHLRRAGLLLSISVSSGREAIDYLGFNEERVVDISTACDSRFVPIDIDDGRREYLRQRYGICRQFVFYTGGIDHRKNIEGLIRAYAKLPKKLRVQHQLAITCSIQEVDRERLLKLAAREDLATDELVITGFVSDEDLVLLYNSCKLFVFPSWHEGFGLPALEAMSCGCPVIGSNRSSIPEVIGREDSLFDPFDERAIMQKINEALTDDDWRAELARHGLVQARRFSWDQSARRAWRALEKLYSERECEKSSLNLVANTKRPRLAYISPLPPEPSGISDYSAELIPELALYYHIDVIVGQDDVSDRWVRANCSIRDVAWFRENAKQYDRVLYHFGNSPFHGHMFALLEEFPGVIVLHDFFLSHVIGHLDYLGFREGYWDRALFESHGWPALSACHHKPIDNNAIYNYPCNLKVLQHSLGVIVHSASSCRLAQKWYGDSAADGWAVIPLLRAPAIKVDKLSVRQRLGLARDDFVVCSFGLLGKTKLNDRLLSSWLASPMAQDPRCRLVFVGQNDAGEYGAALGSQIGAASAAKRIQITGRVDAGVYRDWLAAADIGVQLRAWSRGETSAAVLDCMNFELATIVNANGSMADLPPDAVWMLPDDFSDDQLVNALTILWRDGVRRQEMANRAHEFVRTRHLPRVCALQYAEAIEGYYQDASVGLPALISQVAGVDPPLPAADWSQVATALAHNFPPRPRRRQLLLDVSILAQHDAKSGIQRVVRSLLQEFLINPPDGLAIEPVFANSETEGYKYARRFGSQFVSVNSAWAKDEVVEVWPNDIFLGLDLQHVAIPFQQNYLSKLQTRGVRVYFVVYDLLPILMPGVFPDGTQSMHQRWLETIIHFDGVVCISQAVAEEFREWLRASHPKWKRPFALNWFHLGGDIENSAPTKGLPADAELVSEAMIKRSSFLLVGTIEPRKGHAQTLAAFEKLWREGVDVNLVIVGKQGWKVEELVDKFRSHAELGARLFWLEGISDEFLERVYCLSTCLISASEGEGFGLPLIEAAQHRLPIIARDIPVFREVAGDCAYYFSGMSPSDLAAAVIQWLILKEEGGAPKSENMSWQTWRQAARQILDIILREQRCEIFYD